ncbi:MAG: DUF3662 and FHA domain-containing protein [Microbacteriaceae bacterium]
MGILDDLEKGIERAVNSLFARTFRSGLQPVEIVAALKRELDSKASIVTRERILAPNMFTIKLSPADKARIDSIGEALKSEIRTELNSYAKKQNYRLMGPLSLNFLENSTLGEGMLQVSSESTGRDVVWTPVLLINGRRHRIQSGSTIIGRGTEAGITINDSGASRNHLEIRWNGSKVSAIDLGSTNGTKLNGVKFKTATLNEQDVLQIGRTELVLQLEPEKSSRQAPDREESNS